MNISQSFIKSFTDYKQGNECGIVIYEKYVNKRYPPPSDVMRKGIYFEYLCTGALPLDGKIPEPELVYKGKPNEKLSSEYEKIKLSAELFKRMIEYYKIEIISVSKTITAAGMKGIIDIEAIWNKKKVYIDMKYSGLINDKWSDYGWETESLQYKDNLMIQGIHYKILAKESEGIDDIPFYYWVFSSTNPEDAKIILQNCDPDRIENHYRVVSNCRDAFFAELEIGFKPYPSFKKCQSCYLYKECEHRAEVPLIEIVNY
jgi:hypothetical protein